MHMSNLNWNEKWTVIIPTCNEGDELLLTVKSVLEEAESFVGSVHVLVSDDHSNDYSPQDCQEMFGGRDDFHLVRPPRRLGACHNRRWGYDRAAELWPDDGIAMFTDAHVSLDPGFFTNAAEDIWMHGEGALYTTKVRSRANPDNVCLGQEFKTNASLLGRYSPRRNTIRPYQVMLALGASHIFPRSLYDAIDGFDVGLRGLWGWEDYEVSVRTWLMGYEVRGLPSAELEVMYRQDKAPYGGHDSQIYFYNLVRIALGLFDPEHAEEILTHYRDYRMVHRALYDIATDVAVVRAMDERRKQFKMTSSELLRLFSVDFDGMRNSDE